MGKRTLVRRRGRGGKQFRAITVGKIAPARYPNFKLDAYHTGRIVDIIHERGRNAPLAKIQFDDGKYSYVPAPNGTIVGNTIEVGTSTTAKAGNILALESIPDGTVVCNIEKNSGDGGKLLKAAGSSATVYAHGTEGVTIKLDRKSTRLNSSHANISYAVFCLKKKNISYDHFCLKKQTLTN